VCFICFEVDGVCNYRGDDDLQLQHSPPHTTEPDRAPADQEEVIILYEADQEEVDSELESERAADQAAAEAVRCDRRTSHLQNASTPETLDFSVYRSQGKGFLYCTSPVSILSVPIQTVR
jgi:hypothetical protein